MTPQEFINTVAPSAVASMRKTCVPASFVLAEGGLESGWGAHAPGMNLFGVKADKSWTGAITTQRTREIVKGQPVIITANFRAYVDWQGCIDDHAAFLLNNPRYKPAFEHCGDGIAFTVAIAQAGYATDPSYASKIIQIITQHNLTQYDKEQS